MVKEFIISDEVKDHMVDAIINKLKPFIGTPFFFCLQVEKHPNYYNAFPRSGSIEDLTSLLKWIPEDYNEKCILTVKINKKDLKK